MLVWFSMVDCLQTLTNSQQNYSQIFEKMNIGFQKCLSRYSSHVPLRSSGFVEFYNTDFWMVE